MPKFNVDYTYKIREWGSVEGIEANNKVDAEEQAREYVMSTYGVAGELSDLEVERVEEVV